MTDTQIRVPRGSVPVVVEGPDRGLAWTFVIVPLVLGPVMAFALTLKPDVFNSAVLTALVAVMVRPAIWNIRSFKVAEPRSDVYRRRRDAVANTAFLGGVMICLAIYDVLPLNGGPVWTDQQPRAWITLLAVIVYLIWLSRYARIPAEVRDGWRGLLGR